jgi:hypothetical protein
MALSRRPTERGDDTSAPHRGFMKTLLFVLLATGLLVQDDVAERVQLSKIKDIEKAKSNIKRVAPPYINFGVLAVRRRDREPPFAYPPLMSPIFIHGGS